MRPAQAARNAEESLQSKKKLLQEEDLSTAFWDHQRGSHQSFFFNDGEDVFNLLQDIEQYEKQAKESAKEHDKRKAEAEGKKNRSEQLLKAIEDNKLKKAELVAGIESAVDRIHKLMLAHKTLIASVHHDISTMYSECKRELSNKHR